MSTPEKRAERVSPPARPVLPDVTSDERAEGWGDWRDDEGNDARLREDVPPHW
ncbi:hypothetical protein LO762_17370 [Actinocorallia sp. API 0066]|uniref:hypothetical protein n=1 Tax=Actinocorallia sp. API 0066 TaxID=2896846 RepID=UPI001E59FDCA|nr:hypothetical protein [Actinocorallia sp. API 0066]MCD0450951.1 hypothetical protein [Actinocorallia sp. API 0066]